jgi:4-O-beta-D-mannosyl-D-glucose phosphorylase
MEKKLFDQEVRRLFEKYHQRINRKNKKQEEGNGIYDRYVYPAITRNIVPVFWEYDLNYKTNPNLMKRLGINTTFNAGAIKLNGKYHMMVRVEGFDVKSFFWCGRESEWNRSLEILGSSDCHASDR